MADWDQLRELAREVVPPEFATLERTARRRQRRAGVVVGAVAALALVGGGTAVLTRDRESTVEPAKDPTGTPTGVPPSVMSLPDAPPGETVVDLPAGRYRVALDDTLAFDIDLPDDSAAHNDGLFLATEDFVLKTELAGERYGVPRHPCSDHRIEPVGPGVDALVRALTAMPAYEVSTPAPARLGGLDAVYLEARVPRTYDDSSCEGRAVELPGNPGTSVGGPAPYVGRWWVLEVEGRRVVVQQNCWGCPDDQFDRAVPTPQTITFTSTD